AVKLKVREVRLATRERSHRLERGSRVTGDAEVVGVNVYGMWQPKLMHGSPDRLQHLARGDLEARYLVVDGPCGAARLLVELHPARVDELDAIATGGLKPPCDRVAQVRRDGAS